MSVQAVQTLSRLNRTARGKSDTFVLDFVNDEGRATAVALPGLPAQEASAYLCQYEAPQGVGTAVVFPLVKLPWQ